ncbi:hypothetical protein [Candidatus Lokiarchaeum ossiferum]|uniref:hypothetical protein n=1 Tax=Candidatus Lokiarchaeum ossiferum TaxID=2951803 RepID=UPI00352DE4FB
MAMGLTEREQEYICRLIKDRIKYIESHLNPIERDTIIKDLNNLIQKIQTLSISNLAISTNTPVQSTSDRQTEQLDSIKQIDRRIKTANASSKEKINDFPKKLNKNQDKISSIDSELPKVKSIEEIKVVCEKCDKYMDLFKSLKSEYFRCRRFPRCNVTGDVTQVKRALIEKIVTKRKNADTVKLYRFAENEGVVFVSEVTKEKGLLNSIDEGVWR